MTSHENGIRMGVAGDGNEIHGNHIYKGMIGITWYGYPDDPWGNMKIHNNAIHEMSSVGITLGDSVTGLEVYDNFIYDCNISLRFHTMNEANQRGTSLINQIIHLPLPIYNLFSAPDIIADCN